MIERGQVVDRDHLRIEKQRTGVRGTLKKARSYFCRQPTLLPQVPLDSLQRSRRGDLLESLPESRAELADVALDATQLGGQRARVDDNSFFHRNCRSGLCRSYCVEKFPFVKLCEHQEKFETGMSSLRSSADITQNQVKAAAAMSATTI